MKIIISIVLAFCLVLSSGFLPNLGVSKAWAWPASNDTGVALIAIGALLVSVPIILAVNQKATYDAMQFGWIDAKRTSRQDNYISIIPPSITSLARINENAYVYLSANAGKAFGQVYMGEKYIIEGEKENEEGKWYKLKIESDHILHN